MKKIPLVLMLGIFGNAHGQEYPGLEKALASQLPATSTVDGRWVFVAKDADILKLDKPLVSSVIEGYEFFRVNLTNHLGWHVNQGTCLVLFDSSSSKIVVSAPLWYSGVSEGLVRMLIGKKIGSKDSLLNFLQELHELMEVGSGYQFINTGKSDSLVTYDLGFFKGDSYTTGGAGTSTTIRYNEDGVWRKIRIEIKDGAIIRYSAINPRAGDVKVIE